MAYRREALPVDADQRSLFASLRLLAEQALEIAQRLFDVWHELLIDFLRCATPSAGKSEENQS